MARLLPPGSAYFGTDEPENAYEEDPGMPPDLGGTPPPPPAGMEPPQPPPGAPYVDGRGRALTGGYDEDPEIIGQAAQRYMQLPRAEVEGMEPEDFRRLLDDLEAGYPQDRVLTDAITRMRSQVLPADPQTDAMPLPPEAPGAAGLQSPIAPPPPGSTGKATFGRPPAAPKFTPDRE